LSLLDDISKIGIVWGVLGAKVGELGLGQEAAQALEKWRCDVMSMPQVAGRPLSVQRLQPALSKELHALRITDLCVRPILPDGVVERTGRLLVELRTIASVACSAKTIMPPPGLETCGPKTLEPAGLARDETCEFSAIDL